MKVFVQMGGSWEDELEDGTPTYQGLTSLVETGIGAPRVGAALTETEAAEYRSALKELKEVYYGDEAFTFTAHNIHMHETLVAHIAVLEVSDGETYSVARACEGHEVVRINQFGTVVPCIDCRGSGIFNRSTCPSCDGHCIMVSVRWAQFDRNMKRWQCTGCHTYFERDEWAEQIEEQPRDCYKCHHQG